MVSTQKVRTHYELVVIGAHGDCKVTKCYSIGSCFKALDDMDDRDVSDWYIDLISSELVDWKDREVPVPPTYTLADYQEPKGFQPWNGFSNEEQE